jgi:hypothetical protein
MIFVETFKRSLDVHLVEKSKHQNKRRKTIVSQRE